MQGIVVKIPDASWVAMEISISFPESTFPLSSGMGNERLWDKAFPITGILIPVELRRRERVVQMASDSSSESACVTADLDPPVQIR